MYNQKMMEGLSDGSATKYVLLPWSTQKSFVTLKLEEWSRGIPRAAEPAVQA